MIAFAALASASDHLQIVAVAVTPAIPGLFIDSTFARAVVTAADLDRFQWAVRSAGVFRTPASVVLLAGFIRLRFFVGLAPPLDAIRYTGPPNNYVAADGASVHPFLSPIPVP